MSAFWQHMIVRTLAEYCRPRTEHEPTWRTAPKTALWAIISSLTKESITLNDQGHGDEPGKDMDGFLGRVVLGALLQYWSPNVAKKKVWRIVLVGIGWTLVENLAWWAFAMSRQEGLRVRKQAKLGFKNLSYRTLEDPQHFRIVVLHAGNFDDPISCDIITTSLEGAPPFEALSYVWAQVPGHQTIICTQQYTLSGPALPDVPATFVESLQVTNNLFSALKNLRHGQNPRVLWIDQICTNQGDLQERSQQVQIMRDIYSKAQCVLVWLGEPYEGSDDAMDFIPMLTSALQQLDAAPNTAQLLAGTDDIPSMTSPIWIALLRLFRRPWFGRMWTIQEVIKAEAAVVICGQKETHWQELSACIDESQRMGGIFERYACLLPRSQLGQECSAYLQVPLISRIKRDMINSPDGVDFSTMLKSFENCGATDPRDKIFALWGLLPEEQRNRFERPDYDKPVEEVYIETADTLIKQLKNLELLANAGQTASLPNIPSWVPDWTVPKAPGLTLQKHGFSMIHPAADPTKETAVYRASGDCSASVDDRTERTVLSLRGKLISKVANAGIKFPHVGPGASIASKSGQNEMRIHATKRWAKIEACFKLIANMSLPLYPTAPERLSACRVCLVAGKGIFSQDANTDELATVFSFYKKYLDRWLAVQRRTWWRDHSLDAEFLAMAHEARYASSLIGDATDGRQFFVTEDGHMGLGPHGLVEGDQICIMYGLSVPFVIRYRESGLYSLLGECYVEGIMNGEAIQMENLEETFISLV